MPGKLFKTASMDSMRSIFEFSPPSTPSNSPPNTPPPRRIISELDRELRAILERDLLGTSLGADTEPDVKTSYLNSFNAKKGWLPVKSDVVVIGGGIHSLIYAIHTRTLELRDNEGRGKDDYTSITILEKSESPTYNIGESTLTAFGVWLKNIGIDSPMLWRLFGPRDGLAFYYFCNEDPEAYTSFVANGPPGDKVPTLQIERKISELMLTLYAQRLGITILHSKEAVLHKGLVADIEMAMRLLRVKNTEDETEEFINAKLMIDTTGHFHRLVSKAGHPIEKVDGFNTHGFWAYWECNVDEKEIPLRDYESVNTNHICVPEGWAWVIRLPTWEGSPLPNLINMINHLLDLNAAMTPADEYPSTAELVKMFNLKFRWVMSIGFALRADVVYPDSMAEYGNCESEQKFNWIVSKYTKVTEFMSNFTLIEDLYGPGTTWCTRKNLAFRAPKVSGVGWMSIGDATGFTNPLYSPGINANMATSIYVAEMTQNYLSETRNKQLELRAEYELFCKNRIPNLQRMNVFNYSLFRSPALGPLGPLWQYLIGTGSPRFQSLLKYTLGNCAELVTAWDWGANEDEYIDFATRICKVLEGPPGEELSAETIEMVKEFSAKALKEVIAMGKYKGHWDGLLRYYDDDLVSKGEEERDHDVLAMRCAGCGEWRMLRADMCKCAFCGHVHEVATTMDLYID